MRRFFYLLPFLFLLSACVNDGMSYEINSEQGRSISLLREQPWFWDKKVNLYIVVARTPQCLRRHLLGVGTENSKVEVYEVPSGAFIIKLGKHLFATETETCESFAKIEGEPVSGMGAYRGVFRQKNEQLIFELATVEETSEKQGKR